MIESTSLTALLISLIPFSATPAWVTPLAVREFASCESLLTASTFVAMVDTDNERSSMALSTCSTDLTLASALLLTWAEFWAIEADPAVTSSTLAAASSADAVMALTCSATSPMTSDSSLPTVLSPSFRAIRSPFTSTESSNLDPNLAWAKRSATRSASFNGSVIA